ncbi:hypothetical protein [Legionella yabuuchiae]|uniref:hypothetical protein n=1 Tax=Legionella yabuuchiae TaxID=376727 RepID=UPI00105579F9|nr:hypothetical protein [Legionella yabuuchiae]
MVTKLKKYQITYDQVPKTFGLPETLYLNPAVDALPENEALYSEEQRTMLNNFLSVIKKDLPRTSYVDFGGKTVEDLKSFWVATSPYGSKLAPGVYPGYTQGNFTGGIVGEVIYKYYLSMPLINNNPDLINELNKVQVILSFSYINADGKPAGFSLVALLNDLTPDKKEKGWIITTLQNATAAPEDRAVQVFATDNFVPGKGQSEIVVDGFDSFSSGLRQAINNDKIFHLISVIFNPDGSINAEALRALEQRIPTGKNIDNRDYKQAELRLLLGLADEDKRETLSARINQAIEKDIHFFKDERYERYLNTLLEALTTDLQSSPVQLRQAMKAFIKETATKATKVELFAMEKHVSLQSVPSYKQLTTQIPDQINKLREHLKAIESPTISKQTFLRRNLSALGKGLLVGLLVGIGVALSLTGVLAPIGIAIAAAATALVVGGVSSGIMINQNEQRFAAENRRYQKTITAIKERALSQQDNLIQNCIYEIEQPSQMADEGVASTLGSVSDCTELSIEELPGLHTSASGSFSSTHSNEVFTESTPTSIASSSQGSALSPETSQMPSFLKGIRSKKLNPQTVAHALWRKDEDAEATKKSLQTFSLWAQEKKLPFGEKEVKEVLAKTYQ